MDLNLPKTVEYLADEMPDSGNPVVIGCWFNRAESLASEAKIELGRYFDPDQLKSLALICLQAAGFDEIHNLDSLHEDE